MKYEAVFGDYKFSSPACEVAMQSTFGEIIEMRFTKPLVIPEGWGLIAMRRIIAELNRWTVEDQKAGRLPEVGCRVDFCHKLNTNWRTGEIKYIDNQVAVIKADDFVRPFIYEFDRVEFKPIETPEEKAARLRMEWCNEAGGVCSLGMTTLTRIYDALLSGDLPVPVKGE